MGQGHGEQRLGRAGRRAAAMVSVVAGRHGEAGQGSPAEAAREQAPPVATPTFSLDFEVALKKPWAMVNEIAKVMPAGYAILQAQSCHLPLLNAIELAAARIFPENYLPEQILSDKLPMDVLLAAKDQDLLWLAVEAGGSPVGYVLVQVVDGIALLAQMDVHPDHGRQGLGTALMRHAMGKIREKGFSECYLTTFSDIAWNAPFYAKLGFGVVGEAAMPKAIAAILREEQERGLRNRVAMRLEILDEGK